jgi:hypothetical protein
MVGDWKRVGFKRVEWLSRPHRTGHFGYDSLVAALQGRREGVDDRELLVAQRQFCVCIRLPFGSFSTLVLRLSSLRQLDPKRGGGPLLTAQRFDNKRAFFFYTVFPAAALARFVVEDEWVR